MNIEAFSTRQKYGLKTKQRAKRAQRVSHRLSAEEEKDEEKETSHKEEEEGGGGEEKRKRQSFREAFE